MISAIARTALIASTKPVAVVVACVAVGMLWALRHGATQLRVKKRYGSPI